MTFLWSLAWTKHNSAFGQVFEIEFVKKYIDVMWKKSLPVVWGLFIINLILSIALSMHILLLHDDDANRAGVNTFLVIFMLIIVILGNC